MSLDAETPIVLESISYNPTDFNPYTLCLVDIEGTRYQNAVHYVFAELLQNVKISFARNLIDDHKPRDSQKLSDEYRVILNSAIIQSTNLKYEKIMETVLRENPNIRQKFEDVLVNIHNREIKYINPNNLQFADILSTYLTNLRNRLHDRINHEMLFKHFMTENVLKEKGVEYTPDLYKSFKDDDRYNVYNEKLMRLHDDLEVKIHKHDIIEPYVIDDNNTSILHPRTNIGEFEYEARKYNSIQDVLLYQYYSEVYPYEDKKELDDMFDSVSVINDSKSVIELHVKLIEKVKLVSKQSIKNFYLNRFMNNRNIMLDLIHSHPRPIRTNKNIRIHCTEETFNPLIEGLTELREELFKNKKEVDQDIDKFRNNIDLKSWLNIRTLDVVSLLSIYKRLGIKNWNETVFSLYQMCVEDSDMSQLNDEERRRVIDNLNLDKLLEVNQINEANRDRLIHIYLSLEEMMISKLLESDQYNTKSFIGKMVNWITKNPVNDMIKQYQTHLLDSSKHWECNTDADKDTHDMNCLYSAIDAIKKKIGKNNEDVSDRAIDIAAAMTILPHDQRINFKVRNILQKELTEFKSGSESFVFEQMNDYNEETKNKTLSRIYFFSNQDYEHKKKRVRREEQELEEVRDVTDIYQETIDQLLEEQQGQLAEEQNSDSEAEKDYEGEGDSENEENSDSDRE